MRHLAIIPLSLLRRRAGRLLLLAVVLIATALGGVNLWAWHHYRAAEQALRDDKMDAARTHISSCLRVWRRGPASHLLAARIERVSGHYREAERHLTEAVRLQGGASESTQLEGFLLRAQDGELKRVEGGLWTCIEAGHPQTSQILETLARIHMRDSRLWSAQICLTKWLEREPETARARRWRGWMYERLQQPEHAIPDYEQAVALDPGLWQIRVRLVRLILERNNPGAARAHLDELLRSHSDEADVQIALAQCLQLEGEEDKAIEVLDRLLAAQPDSFEALAQRGRLEARRQRPAEAEVQLRKALRHRPSDPGTLYLLYQCLEQQGKDKEAAEILKRHKTAEKDAYRLGELWGRIEKDPTNADLLSEVGAILLRMGEGEEAVNWLHRALSAGDDRHKPSLRLLMRYWESQGDAAQANDYRRVLEKLNGGKSLAASLAATD